ncbi:DUF742 domain-containing protein [Saccharothrix coeruleofusca]|uniref:Uncharacterized protein n=1 Tax=Saccharothrix coeruleofusca TaxID=33919 RepID=A0A918ARZ0_9PSEU|nr:DUF742 domain-containing protein [Saccharothrix coeruleofusca]MBP2334950.1 hypothetical protein [Saccharothrix coeruleofusca]GGP68139.1 hypothetical protein GCM10010185_46190 [Saccharothrix coeruleofusca]
MSTSNTQRDRFGGWADYGEWADRDFRVRTPADETGTGGSRTTVVEVLTQLSPVALPRWFVEGRTQDGSDLCRLTPGEDGTPECVPEGEDATVVRPYVRAGGRAEAAHDLQFETVLTATGLHEEWPGERELDEDQMRICRQCESPQSVAEIAVAIDAPIGVAKVLIGDALDLGLLVPHDTAPIFDGKPPLALLKRVHASLAKLA